MCCWPTYTERLGDGEISTRCCKKCGRIECERKSEPPGSRWRTERPTPSPVSHPSSEDIYKELARLDEELRQEGYRPDTRYVLHDMREEDKVKMLCSHSERIAIAFGLLRTSRFSTLRLKQNMRVCPDCHAATALISKVRKRELIVRDSSRFHVFKDGVCSCHNYW